MIWDNSNLIDLEQYLNADSWVLAYLPLSYHGDLYKYINIVGADDEYIYFVAVDADLVDAMLDGGELNDYEEDDIQAAILISQRQDQLSENVLLSLVQDDLVYRVANDIKITIYPTNIYSTADIEEILHQCLICDSHIGDEDDEE